MDGMKEIEKVCRVLNFNILQKEKGEKILSMIREMTVEEGVELLEKCIFQHAYYVWERKYMTEPLPYGIGPVDDLPKGDKKDG